MNYMIKIDQWSATDYAFLINNSLGFVSDDGDYWEFFCEENMNEFQRYLNENTNRI